MPSVAKVRRAEVVLSSATLPVRSEGAGARRSCPVCVPRRRRRGHGVSNCSFPRRPSPSVARAQGVRILVGAPRRRWRGCRTRCRLSLSICRRPQRGRVARQSSFSSATLAVRSEGTARCSCSSSAPFAVRGEGAARGGGSSPRRPSPSEARARCAAASAIPESEARPRRCAARRCCARVKARTGAGEVGADGRDWIGVGIGADGSDGPRRLLYAWLSVRPRHVLRLRRVRRVSVQCCTRATAHALDQITSKNCKKCFPRKSFLPKKITPQSVM